MIGENRKLVIFPLAELPEMTRGQGVALQRYRDGGLSDATSLVMAQGLSWAMGGESGPHPHRSRSAPLARGTRRGGADAAQWLPAR